jgi:hypothetical protein
MTIKQQGGVFGRNPTFNEVDAATGNITTVNATTVNATTVDATTAQADGVEITSASGDIDMLWAAGSVHRVGSDYAGSYFTGMRVSADTRNVDLISLDPSGLGNFRVFTGVTEVEQLSINPTGNVTLHTGNLIVANGNGIDFSATAGTGTSELFDDYEEGTWTPTINGSAMASGSGWYTRIGQMVTIGFNNLTGVTAVTSGSSFTITGIPFNVKSDASIYKFGGSSSISFNDASDGYKGYNLVGRVTNSSSNNLECSNQSGVATTTGDPFNLVASYVGA